MLASASEADGMDLSRDSPLKVLKCVHHDADSQTIRHVPDPENANKPNC